MGSACSSTESSVRADPNQLQRHREIEKGILVEKQKKALKLLLLGPGDSGKSTTLKQIRIIHDTGFSDEERLSRKYIVYQNLLSAMVQLIACCEELNMVLQLPGSGDCAKIVQSRNDCHKSNEGFQLDPDLADSMEHLLKENAIQQLLIRSSEFNIDDSAKYFLTSLNRLRATDYIPSTEDMLKSRVSTSGVIQFSFFIKNYMFRVFDVGGQKSQRRKWIHIFDDVHAVLFITSLSEYNQTLFEDCAVNRMRDSIGLFDQICNNGWFANTAMILFLNKKDLFEEKIKHYPITIALPRYKGPQEYRESLDHIKEKYVGRNKNEKRPIYTHETCATDTKAIQVVIDSVIDVVIQQTMQRVGIQ